MGVFTGPKISFGNNPLTQSQVGPKRLADFQQIGIAEFQHVTDGLLTTAGFFGTAHCQVCRRQGKRTLAVRYQFRGDQFTGARVSETGAK